MNTTTETLVKQMNKIMRGIFNMSFEDFKEEFDVALGFQTKNSYAEENFSMMRSDFFLWWINLSTNAQNSLASAALAKD